MMDINKYKVSINEGYRLIVAAKDIDEEGRPYFNCIFINHYSALFSLYFKCVLLSVLYK